MTLSQNIFLSSSEQLTDSYDKKNHRQERALAEPRENADLFPPKGNLHKSSYRRIGFERNDSAISETCDMLSQIKLQDVHKPITYPRRNLFTMQSFASAEKECEEKELRVADFLLNPIAFRNVNYRTTMKNDYQSPYPMKPKTPPSPPPLEPWLLNRRTIGYSLHDLENRSGYRKFLDDDMDLHRKIAELKMRRNKLYEVTMNQQQNSDNN